jgi:phenylacetate-CoA ligase
MAEAPKAMATPADASAPDFMRLAPMRELQTHRLKAAVRLAYENVAFYRHRLETSGVDPEDIHALEDIARLPFTQKDDLRDTYPYGLLARPIADIVRLHASSGTTGKPILSAYTREDLEVWTSAMVRTLRACSLRREDIVQNAYGYGLFTGGLGFHYGAEALGATVIPVSGGNTERQIMIMRDCRVTAFCSTPSYFVHVIERAEELGIDVAGLDLRVAVLGAEPWSESMRRHIEDSARIKAYDMYGLAEIAGPGIASECTSQDGLHILEDHFYPEIIDPETGAILPEGAEGELVLTTLSKRAMPVLRYRTRDITALIPGQCSCGRTLRRMRRIGRRSDDMFIIRGVNVFPSQIEAALMAVEGTLPHYQIVLTRQKGLDEMEIQVEVTQEVFSDKIRALDSLHTRLLDTLEHSLGLRVLVRFVEPHNIQRSEGKAKRLIDRRNLVEK